jgi:hypothetical protein
MRECPVSWRHSSASRYSVADLAGLSAQARSFLEQVSPLYIWWKAPDEALLYPDRLIAQIMDTGNYEDTRNLERLVGLGRLRAVIDHAEAGWFRPRSWSYWHYRLGLVEPGDDMPPMPERVLGNGAR